MNHTFKVTISYEYELSTEDLKRLYGTDDPTEAADNDQDNLNDSPATVYGDLKRYPYTATVIPVRPAGGELPSGSYFAASGFNGEGRE